MFSDGQDKNLHAPVLRGAQHVPLHVLRSILRRVFHVLVLHVPPKDKR